MKLNEMENEMKDGRKQEESKRDRIIHSEEEFIWLRGGRSREKMKNRSYRR